MIAIGTAASLGPTHTDAFLVPSHRSAHTNTAPSVPSQSLYKEKSCRTRMGPFNADVMESIPHQASAIERSGQESMVLQRSTKPLISQTASSSSMMKGAKDWLASTSFSLLPEPAFAETEPPKPPTNGEVQLLRKAFATFYGASRDAEAAEPLLTEAIQAWERQSADEKAGLYRVRGDCYAALLQVDKAIADYTTAIDLLKSPDGEKADPAELPASLYVFNSHAAQMLLFLHNKTNCSHFHKSFQSWPSTGYPQSYNQSYQSSDRTRCQRL